MKREGMEKVMYCYYCKADTIYKKYRQNNSYTESHCSVCEAKEWQNKVIYQEIKKWIEFNREKGLMELPDLK
ncbi:hypothetical protein ACFVP8_20305 [Viridibacillus arvi]|uniref:hypothetical protein n=1 Tax=Viridibacillus arvi TaxID=263475 RepID=UPI0036C0CCB8